MRNVKLASNDSGEFELGLTQDASEITNANGYRVLVNFNGDVPAVIGVEGVNADGVWDVIKSESFVTLLGGVLSDNLGSIDLDQLKTTSVFYVEILKNVEGDPYRGILAPLDEMNRIIDAPNPSIDEARFVRDYAIFFLQHYPTMCDVDKDYPAKYAAAMKRWSTEVAQLNTPVDVVEHTDQGKVVLYTIPAALASNEIFNNNRGLEIHEIMHEAAHIGQTNPAGAETFVERELSSKLDTVPVGDLKRQDRERVEIFDDIRERYNIARWLPKAPKVDENTTTAPDSTASKSTGFSDNEMGEF